MISDEGARSCHTPTGANTPSSSGGGSSVPTPSGMPSPSPSAAGGGGGGSGGGMDIGVIVLIVLAVFLIIGSCSCIFCIYNNDEEKKRLQQVTDETTAVNGATDVAGKDANTEKELQRSSTHQNMPVMLKPGMSGKAGTSCGMSSSVSEVFAIAIRVRVGLRVCAECACHVVVVVRDSTTITTGDALRRATGANGIDSPLGGFTRNNRENMMQTRSSHMSTGISKIDFHQTFGGGGGGAFASQFGGGAFANQPSFAQQQQSQHSLSSGGGQMMGLMGTNQLTGLQGIMNTQNVMGTQMGMNTQNMMST